MTSSGTAVVTLPTHTQILITREFAAPKHLVYKAWTTPELIKRWWSGDRGEVTSGEAVNTLTLTEKDGRTTRSRSRFFERAHARQTTGTTFPVVWRCRL